MRRQGHHGKPEIFNGSDRLNEGVESDGLGDKGVGVQFVAFNNIFLGAGSSQYQHWDEPEIFICFDFRQHFAAILFGQIQIEQDKLRTRCIEIRGLSAQESDRFDAILDDMKTVAEMAFGERVIC